jgi:tRNA-uridine 2-sulfurtransferase
MTASQSTRIAVGMSGGIDSSVAAALLVAEGFEVIGLSLHMFHEGSRCCSIEDVERARRVSSHLGIRHYVMNVLEDFEQSIVRPFADDYARGRTPNPCILCNRLFKFGAMLRRAVQLGCSHLATGHYACVESRADGCHLLRAADAAKDQSYFLHRLDQAQLARIRFPLGHMTKPEVRAAAARMHLPIQGARETADLCFITAAGPAPLVERYHPELRREGNVVDEAGHVLGRHDGFHRFTIGQRDKVGVATGRRVYVTELRPTSNTVVVAGRDAVASTSCLVSNVHWIAGGPPPGDCLEVCVRYRSSPVPAVWNASSGDTLSLAFGRPVFAVAPGQAAVFLREDEVLGGGWIERAGAPATGGGTGLA